MPWAKLWLDAYGKGSLLHALVDLEQMRMRFADTDPNNLRWAFSRKCADASDR